MSYMVAYPEFMSSAASDLASIGTNVSAAHMVAAARTVAVIPAAADEVSAGIAHLFSRHAQDYQALAGQASAFHDQFVQHLTTAAHSYTSAEAANAAALLKPSAVAAFLDELLNPFNTGLSQLNNSLTTILDNALYTVLNILSGGVGILFAVIVIGWIALWFLASAIIQIFGLSPTYS